MEFVVGTANEIMPSDGAMKMGILSDAVVSSEVGCVTLCTNLASTLRRPCGLYFQA